MHTYTTSHTLVSPEHVIFSFKLSFTYVPATPGRLSGPPEDCYPAEPAELEITSISLVSIVTAAGSTSTFNPALDISAFFGEDSPIMDELETACFEYIDDLYNEPPDYSEPWADYPLAD